MKKGNNIPIVKSPTLIDAVFSEIQIGLKANLSWLDYAFGRAQRVTKKIKDRTYIFPACFAGKEEYLDVSPDSNLGCFSFFIVNEPQIIEWIPNQLGRIEVPFALIVWFDLRKVFPQSYNERNTEAIKAEILKALNLYIKPESGRFIFNRMLERAENIYKEFSGVMEIDNQFMLHPYGGFRFDGTLTINQPCY